ncbi:hypothetical protein GCM10027284_38470 [Cyclobacterium sediminis]
MSFSFGRPNPELTLIVDQAKVRQDSLMNLVNDYLDSSKFQNAVTILHLLLENNKEELSTHNLRDIHTDLGYSYYYLGKFDSSNFYYTKANVGNRAMKDTIQQIGTLKSLGINFREQGMYSLALEKYKEALTISSHLDEPKLYAEIFNSLALTYQEIGEIEKAIFYNYKTLKIWEGLADSLRIANSFNNLAITYSFRNQYDSSLYFNTKALAIKRRLGDKLSLASTVNNIGFNYLNLDSLSKARRFLNEGLILHKELNDVKGVAISYNNLADLNLKKNNYHKAIIFLDSAKKILQIIDSKKLLSENIQLQIVLMEKRGDYQNALSLHKEWDSLNALLFQEEKLKVREVESRYLLREKELENQKIGREKELIDIQYRRNIFYSLYLAIGIVLLVVLLAFLIYYFLRSIRQNKIIKTQQLELKHRTNNLLSIIYRNLGKTVKGMLDIESKQKLMENQRVILTAASLEEFLYSIEDQKSVPISRFLNRLAEKLMEMHNVGTFNNINIKVESRSEFYLPEDKVLNIGLIVTELVTNAIKHAFSEDQLKPQIKISLQGNKKLNSLSISDNGVGLPEGKTTGIGHKLIDELASYIDGKLKSDSNNGAVYTLIFN